MRVGAGVVWAVGCAGDLEGSAPTGGATDDSAPVDTVDTSAPTPTDTGTAPAGWRWVEVPTAGVTPRWGATTAGPYVIGGVDAEMAVTDEVLAVDANDGTLRATGVSTLSLPRYCACALYDPTRDELVVIGGRDDRFADAPSAELHALGTGEVTPLDGIGADDRPVGCQAFFLAGVDRGYVVGGYGTGAGFGATTWRYDPTDRSFTALDAPGPTGRYDAGVEVLDDGTALLVGGMGFGGFDSQVWRFDPAAEQWTELPPASEVAPPGRRFPFTAVHDGQLVYGYGTDSATGATVLRDLWTFDVEAGVWAAVDVPAPKPTARAFAGRWPGPPGTLGAIAFGLDDQMTALADAWALIGP